MAKKPKLQKPTRQEQYKKAYKALIQRMKAKTEKYGIQFDISKIAPQKKRYDIRDIQKLQSLKYNKLLEKGTYTSETGEQITGVERAKEWKKYQREYKDLMRKAEKKQRENRTIDFFEELITLAYNMAERFVPYLNQHDRHKGEYQSYLVSFDLIPVINRERAKITDGDSYSYYIKERGEDIVSAMQEFTIKRYVEEWRQHIDEVVRLLHGAPLTLEEAKLLGKATEDVQGFSSEEENAIREDM